MSEQSLKGYVRTSAGQVHYRESAGTSADLSPVVFFHRSPMSGATFEPVFAQLAGQRRLVAFDVPGFGQSCPVPDGTSLAQIADILSEAMGALGIDAAHLIGHHSGCAIAAELAARPGNRIRSILLDGAMIADAEARRGGVPAAPQPEITREGDYLAAAWGFLQPYYTIFEPRLLHDGLVGALQSLFTRGPTMAAIRDYDLRETLSRVTCPILACAASDDVFAAHLERVQAVHPGAEVHRYGMAGIAGPELQPEAFAELVRRTLALAGSAS